MDLQTLREQYKTRILAIAKEHRADNIRVFGSVARGNATESSDIDLLVHFNAEASLLDLAALDRKLTELIGREVDVVSDRAIRENIAPHILNDATPL